MVWISKLLAAALLAVCASAQSSGGEWKPLFDGKSLSGWRDTEFQRHGKARVENGAIVLEAGKPLSGVNYTGSFPTSNYEIRFEAMKKSGGDFFASLTFPIRSSHATWVTGGWGGDIVGISSLDGWDASENETRTYYEFKPGEWYRFRLLVLDDRLTAWINDEQVVNLKIADRTLSLRAGEIELSKPLGFASYNTTGLIRNVEYRELPRKR
jgi:hypothetical protein